MPYRQLEGFTRALHRLVPTTPTRADYSGIRKRILHLPIEPYRDLKETNEPVTIAVDSTGISVHRAGGWIERKHGKKHVKLHVAVDHHTVLPLAALLAPANDNEKKHAPSLVEKARGVLGRAGARLRSLVTDSQYSSRKVREFVEEAVIPYTANQRGEGILRVDRKFKTHDPDELVREYHKRPLVESVFSFLKDQYGLRVNNVRGLVNVSVYVLLSLLCHVLVREAAEGMGLPEKALSPTFFNT